jgi:uncharacterized cupin superfamily protein
MANINEPIFDELREHPGFRCSRARLGRQIGSAHQLANRTEEPVRFLALSTSGDPDIVIYPDSQKVGAFERRPQGGGLFSMFRMSDAVDYHDGERAPE